MKIKIAVLTVNFNGTEKTTKLIESLKESTHQDYLVYVVDNGSEIEKYQELKKAINPYKKKIKLIRSEKNLGWGGGCNIGLKEIIKDKKTPLTFVVGNDSKIGKNTLEECYKTMQNKEIGICGVKSLNEDGTIQTTGGRIPFLSKITGIPKENKKRLSSNEPVILRDEEFMDDCGWMIRTHNKNDIVWYPDHLFMYFEEIYITKGIRKKGLKIAYNPHATITHEGYGSSGVVKNPLPVFYITRNRFLFMKDFYPKTFPLFLPIYFLIILPAIMIKYTLQKNKHLIPYVLKGINSGITYLKSGKKKFLLKDHGIFTVKEVS